MSKSKKKKKKPSTKSTILGFSEVFMMLKNEYPILRQKVCGKWCFHPCSRTWVISSASLNFSQASTRAKTVKVAFFVNRFKIPCKKSNFPSSKTQKRDNVLFFVLGSKIIDFTPY